MYIDFTPTSDLSILTGAAAVVKPEGMGRGEGVARLMMEVPLPQLKRLPTLKGLSVGLPALLKTSPELRPQLKRSPTLKGVVERGAGVLCWCEGMVRWTDSQHDTTHNTMLLRTR